MKATSAWRHRAVELAPLILSVAMLIVGAAFILGLVVPQQSASGIVLFVGGGLLSITNWKKQRAQVSAQQGRRKR